MYGQKFLSSIVFCSILVLPGTIVKAQNPTIIKSVSLENRRDSVRIEWYLIKNQNVSNYAVAHKDPRDPTAWLVVGSTQNSFDSTFVFRDSTVKTGPVSFRMKAEYSANKYYALGNTHTLNFLKITSDTCSFSFHLKWTGYKGWGDSLNYQVIVKEGSKAERPLPLIAYSNDSLDFPLPQSDTVYNFVIRALKTTDSLESYSNQVAIFMHIAKVPAFIYADFATINSNGKIALSFSIDLSSGIKTYDVLRSESESGPYTSVHSFSNITSASLVYTDNQSDPQVQHYYKLSARNSCNNYVKESNLAGNIVLKAIENNGTVSLNWNQYTTWPGGQSMDSLFRSTPGGGWEFVAAIPPSVTSYTDQVDSLSYRNYSDKICYYLKAHSDSLNPAGKLTVSQSNVSCVGQPSAVKIPNAFTPNGDLVNDEFTIRFDFIPAEYLLKIFDRNGNLIFQTTDYSHYWDGKDPSGRSVMQGTYVYYLRYGFQGQNPREKRGTISVLYP